MRRAALVSYGLGRFPVTLYYEQWIRLLDAGEDLRDFPGNQQEQPEAQEFIWVNGPPETNPDENSTDSTSHMKDGVRLFQIVFKEFNSLRRGQNKQRDVSSLSLALHLIQHR